ncbi:MAG: DUF2304 domain-containing protein [Bacillota bacterium]|nr:DUF2304 domain-containing protein [Bacillota bacterium]
MSINLTIALIVLAILFLVITLRFIKKGRLPVRYSLIWMFISFVMILCALLPSWLIDFTKLIGFQTTSNLIIGAMFVVLFVLSMILTMIVSKQKKQLTLLTQEISLLKSKMKDE